MTPLQQACLSICLTVACIGCARSGPEIVPVVGVATRDGKPLANLYITFEPDEGRTSWATTDSSGNFTLNYSKGRDGARVGRHKVYVRFRPSSVEEETSGKFRPPAGMDDILRKFGNSETTQKTVEITSETRDIELKFD
ncbi:MAG TPA: hypothetical protein VL096_04505 [Pirellulaceae bacterium]|nr:hypothetical protein [Pirellulaceae bacterium]